MIHKPNLLIVDDDIASQLVYEAMFSGTFNVITASSGFEALGIFKEEIITMVFMNCQMPVMSGFETAKQMRMIEGKSATPIIFVTAFDSDHIFEENPMAFQKELFIHKPFDSQDISKKLEQFLW
ncbi:MAG TPA: response regulator [Bacteriovoracaceae bacterium]|nr:response regulator [Bacteriovoracaceae bacterium]